MIKGVFDALDEHPIYSTSSLKCLHLGGYGPDREQAIPIGIVCLFSDLLNFMH